jgi:hypothetical protein
MKARHFLQISRDYLETERTVTPPGTLYHHLKTGQEKVAGFLMAYHACFRLQSAFTAGMLLLCSVSTIFGVNLPKSQCLDPFGGSPALSVDLTTGNYSVTSGPNQFTGSQIVVDGINVLQYSSPFIATPDWRRFTRIVNGLQFTVDFTRIRGPWLGISLSVRNVSASEIQLTGVQLFSASYLNAFQGGSLGQLEAYTNENLPKTADHEILPDCATGPSRSTVSECQRNPAKGREPAALTFASSRCSDNNSGNWNKNSGSRK